MDESIQLLSSMSPKVKGAPKPFKGTSVLALKKHFRRSSIYDKYKPTPNNESLNLVEGSSTTNSSSTEDKQKINKHEASVIVIPDSDNELEANNDLLQCNLSKKKINEIECWIDKVNKENESEKDSTIFSEVSTIIGAEFNNEKVKNNVAVNSTFCDIASKRFDELFKKDLSPNFKQTDYNNYKKYCSDSDTSSIDFDEAGNAKNREETIISIEDSLIIKDDKKKLLKDSSFGTDTNKEELNKINESVNNLTIDDSLNLGLNESLNTKLKKRNNSKQCVTPQHKTDKSQNRSANESSTPDKNKSKEESIYESMLDDLYGENWRSKKDLVLSEPRRKAPKNDAPSLIKSERKPSLLYKNPYLDSEKIKSNNLLKTLQTARLKKDLESPWRPRLNKLCDSDTSSSSDSDKPLPKQQRKTKLNFFDDSDSDDDNQVLNENSKVSKYFSPKPARDLGKKMGNKDRKQIGKITSESDKENVSDFSENDDSLEERIRKKLNNVKDVKTKTKTKTGNKNVDKKIEGKEKNNAKKITKKKSTSSDDDITLSSGDEWDKKMDILNETRINETKNFKGVYSFLASLSKSVPTSKCDTSAMIFRNNYKQYRTQLTEKLFKLYNEKIFDKSIPDDTPLEWNDRMNKTAGYCYCRKITKRTGAVERKVRIVLSTKVIDSPDRLRDTLVHEMCHAATWIVNCVSDGHGPYWKSWAYKAIQTFPELPPIKRCHDYVINTKYTYRCTKCGYSIGRHSKSLDIERKRCGYCLGTFEILINKTTKKGETKTVPVTPRKEATGFALFVKENYSTYKTPSLKHGDVMKILGQKFADLKVKQTNM